MIYLAFAVIVVGCVATGGYLVMHEHPWFGLLAMLMGASAGMTSGKKGEK